MVILFNENIVVQNLFCSGAYPAGPCASQQWESIDFLWSASPSAAHLGFFHPQNASLGTLPSMLIPMEVPRRLLVVRVAVNAAQKWAATLQGQALVTPTLEAAASLSSLWLWVSSQLVAPGPWVSKISSRCRKDPTPQEWLFRESVI